jgi:L(+)-tartrate dehydratase beta subunit
MPHHVLTTPITQSQVRALRVDDTVTLQGTLFGIRDATQIAMFDRGTPTASISTDTPSSIPHRT